MLAKSLRWALAGLVACPSAALALGLGDIHLLSALNAPLDATIELVGATPDELADLRPQIASRETFAQHGLDWAPFLANVTVREVRTPDGHEVLELRSTQPVTEPFLTVLVELDWDRGQLLHEYDLLLDPPVYTPNQGEVAHAVAPPVSGSGVRQGTIERAAPEAAASAPAAASAAAASPPSSSPSSSPPAVAEGGAAAPSSYEVRRGDTLSRIASQLSGGSRADERRWMVAAYDGNPGAFDHNMNWLRAGAVLRIPSTAAVDAISPADASAEVHRQFAAWRSGAAGGAGAVAQTGRLRLVVPGSSSSTSAGAGAGAASSAGPSEQALQGEVQSLQTQLDAARRLLDMRNAELSQLQAQLAARAGGAAAAGAAGAPAAQAPPPAEAPQAPPPAENPPVSATPPVAEQPPAVKPPVTHPPVAHPPVKRPIPVSHPKRVSPLGAWLDAVRGLWWVVVLALLAALAYLGLRGWSSRRKAGFDDSLGRLAEAGASSQGGSRDPSLTEPHLALKRESSFLVEESGTHERPRLESAAPAPAARHVEADESMTGETTALNLDQGDPLAEADFHMAYGLYDQAADLVRIGIQREPERRDLKLKLLEVFFVWGNKEQFLQTARELAATRAQAAPGEWEKVVIMGKQLAADDPLFAGGTAVSGAAAGGVDLDLEGGQHRVDFDILGEAAPPAQEVVDLDIGTAIGERDPVAEAAAQQATDKNLALDDSLVLPEDATAERAGVTATQRMTGTADSGIGATREMTGTARELTGSTREMTTTLDRDWNPTQLLPEAPTVEQPALRSEDNPTIREKVQMALRAGANSEHTTELALDDLGLDLNALHEEAPGSPEGTSPDDGPGSGGAAAEGPTLVAGLDEHSRRLIETAEQRAASDSDDGELKITETGSWHFDNDPLAAEDSGATATRRIAPAAADHLADTSRLTALRPSAGVDFEIGEPEEAPRRTNGSGGGVDLDVGTATVPDAAFAATQRLQSEDLALPELEPVTMSEVGTKLDLARAYMDMGDPEGARNILEEVLTEGSVAQKQEAERLIAALPG